MTPEATLDVPDRGRSEAHVGLRARVRDLARELVSPSAAAVDAAGVYPQAWFDAFREHDLLGLSVPVHLGGTGLGVGALAVATEEMARASSTAGLMLLLSRLPIAPLLLNGTQAQQQRWVHPVATGRARGAFAMSELESGSDVLGLQTTARTQADGSVRLTGTKAWVSGLEEADWYAIVARDAIAAPRSGAALAVHLVRRGAVGLRTEVLEKSGVRGCSFGHLHLDSVRADDSVDTGGIRGLLKSLATMRPVVSARGLGLALAAYELAQRYAGGREVSGQPVSARQGIRWALARLAIDIECARLLTRQAARMVDDGDVGPGAMARLAMAKYVTSETAVAAARQAVQLHGAAGCVAGHPADILHRDASQLTIIEGTSEIQLEIIAQQTLAQHDNSDQLE